MRAEARSGIIGVILAGGLSRRMGGGDKGLLELAGKPMLSHVVERLAPQVARLIINANGAPERFSALGLPVVADTVTGFAGPLAGVLAGMRWALTHAPDASFIVSAAGDAPLLPRDLAVRLADAVRGGGGRIALAQSYGALHPVIGLWPLDLADDLEAGLRGGIRKVLDFTRRHGTVCVPFAPVELCGLSIDPFFNANTPAELDQLRGLLARGTR